MNIQRNRKKRIAVAMSGGVDSSVAACLLADEGHELVGLTAWTLNGPGKCCNDALVNAGRVCEMLNMPYDTVDLRAEFSHFVMDYYHNSYAQGLTPNPCVECNRYVKWEQLLHYAQNTLGVDYIATGHYAKLERSPGNPFRLLRSKDAHKDQTYMMARVYRKDLEATLFPLADMTKDKVYEIARKRDLPTAYSKESQDICFVLNGQANYLSGVLGTTPGPIVDIDTQRVLGEHDGHYLFTVGQRKGVKIAAGRPIYVVKVDPETNTVFVGDKHHLETQQFQVKTVNWICAEPKIEPFEAMVKIRYNTPATHGTVYPNPKQPEDCRIELSTPQMAITPGQIAAFYDPEDQELWGGGYIEHYVQHESFDAEAPRELPNLFCTV